MKDPNRFKSALHRRDLIKGVAAAGLGLAAGGLGSSSAFAAPNGDNPIRKENAKPGTRDWLLTKSYNTAETTSQHTRTQITQP